MELFDPKSLAKINLNDYENFNGIPNLFIDDGNKINKVQSDFYNEIKFPNYNNFDDLGSLIEKTTKNFFLKKLDNEIGYSKKILEAGCGTGKLSIFLSRYKRSIYGIDLSIGSLLEAKKFIDKNNINNVNFYRMNIFKMFFPKNYFDIVIIKKIFKNFFKILLYLFIDYYNSIYFLCKKKLYQTLPFL